MLSFFRKKSTGTIDAPTVDGIIPKMEQLSTTKPQQQQQHDASACEEALQSSELVQQLGYGSLTELRETVYDILRTIKDPEKPQTLEDLNVVYEEGIFVKDPTSDNVNVIRVEFNPTVPHCSLATLIGLCIRVKIERSIPHALKLDIYIKKGAHSTEDEINKQINDKERIAAAMENPNLRTLVEDCIKEED